ncbi:MAG: multidrug effflux MFS transporter [Rhodobacteraceae bacterium]|nr:multidrug effflux MFS transporter [Paracoccaceae bacterium]
MNNLSKPRFLDPHTPPTLFTLVVIAATAALSLNIFLPSLPAITEYFDASYSVVQFLVSGYLLTTVIVQFLVGPMSDRFGRRPVLLVGLALFVLASILCATATSVYVLLPARVLQASVVAGFAVSRAAIRDMSSDGAAASKIGYVTMGMAIAPMTAPMVGGFLQEIYGWQSGFWVLAAAGGFTLLLCWRDLGETNRHKSSSFMVQVSSYPELLKSRRFWSYATCGGLGSACFFAMLGGAPFVGDKVYGLSPSQLGIYFMFTPTGYMIGNFFTGRFAERFGISRLMIAGATITSIGMSLSLLVIALGATHPLAFFAFTISIGLGNGLVIPNATAGMLNVHPRLAGTAAGLGGAMLTLCGAIISAIVASLLTVERGVFPLLICIIISALLALFFARYAASLENQALETAV